MDNTAKKTLSPITSQQFSEQFQGTAKQGNHASHTSVGTKEGDYQTPPASTRKSEGIQARAEPVIKVRGLDNAFNGFYVHKNLNLDVYAGDILGVVGGSGTGKSVLLRSIVGLRRPTAGSVQVLGKSMLDLSSREREVLGRNLGVLFQGGALYSSLTVLENVAFPLIEQLHLSRKDAEHIAMLKVLLVGLPENAAFKYPAELSGGMIKRAALARALALDPKILFLDEPTAGLDPISAAAFDQLMLTLRDALGLTMFLVTHDLDTLYTACSRVAVLSDKQVLINDTIDKVEQFNHPWIQQYFNGPRGRAAYQAHEAQQVLASQSGDVAGHQAHEAQQVLASQSGDVAGHQAHEAQQVLASQSGDVAGHQAHEAQQTNEAQQIPHQSRS